VGETLREAFDEAWRRILEAPPPAPCGSKERPHRYWPGAVRHGRVRCAVCGDRLTLLAPNRTRFAKRTDFGARLPSR
jgi:hypothetical protein